MPEESKWVEEAFEHFLKLTPEESAQVDIQFHRDKVDEDYLSLLEKLNNNTTPGPWYPRAGDDDMCMNARWVSTDPGKGFEHDGFIHDHDSTKCVAITLLQHPRLVEADDPYDDNLLFICEAKHAVPRLVAEVRALRAELAELKGKHNG